MCIIVLKPKGVTLSSRLDMLKTCWSRNSDGAGVMFPSSGGVHIEKGFMEWEELELFLQQHDEPTKDLCVALHFRIATHGTVSQSNCHPFPVTRKDSRLSKISCNAEVGVMHNGIIDGMTSRTDKVSDSYVFVRDYLAPFRKDVMSEAVTKLVMGLCGGNKFVFMSNNVARMIGDAFTEDDGWFFSNTSFKALVMPKGRVVIPSAGAIKQYVYPGHNYDSEEYWNYMPPSHECLFCGSPSFRSQSLLCYKCDPTGALVGKTEDEVEDILNMSESELMELEYAAL